MQTNTKPDIKSSALRGFPIKKIMPKRYKHGGDSTWKEPHKQKHTGERQHGESYL